MIRQNKYKLKICQVEKYTNESKNKTKYIQILKVKKYPYNGVLLVPHELRNIIMHKIELIILTFYTPVAHIWTLKKKKNIKN